jgi:hypothetical protein
MKTKTKRTKMIKKTVKDIISEPYTASIKILGKIYSSTGNSVKEALENLKPEGKCAGISILSVSRGDVKKDKILTSMQTYRIFSPSKIMRQVALKGVNLLFNL